jgi:hypothetical protein
LVRANRAVMQKAERHFSLRNSALTTEADLR